jgi:hypothetical protein
MEGSRGTASGADLWPTTARPCSSTRIELLIEYILFEYVVDVSIGFFLITLLLLFLNSDPILFSEPRLDLG